MSWVLQSPLLEAVASLVCLTMYRGKEESGREGSPLLKLMESTGTESPTCSFAKGFQVFLKSMLRVTHCEAEAIIWITGVFLRTGVK